MSANTSQPQPDVKVEKREVAGGCDTTVTSLSTGKQFVFRIRRG
jgi:hypothetical protein